MILTRAAAVHFVVITVFPGFASLPIEARAQVVPPARVDYLLPGVANTPGQKGSHWQTDLDITNHDVDAALTLCYASNTGSRDCVALPTITSGQSVHFSDIALTLFNKPGTFGVVTVTTNQDPADLEARARTYNLVTDAGSPLFGGTLGGTIPTIPSTGLLNQTVPARVSGAPDTVDFRQNITFFTTDQASTITARLRDNMGNALSTKAVTLGPWSVLQQSMATFFGTGWPDSYVDLDVTNGGVGAYISINDNKSNAPTVNSPFSRSPSSTDQWVVSSANTAGADNTTWRTSITLNSTFDDNVQLATTLLVANNDNSTATPRFIVLNSQEQRSLDDVVGTYLSTPGQYGALRLQSSHPLARGDAHLQHHHEGRQRPRHDRSQHPGSHDRRNEQE